MAAKSSKKAAKNRRIVDEPVVLDGYDPSVVHSPPQESPGEHESMVSPIQSQPVSDRPPIADAVATGSSDTAIIVPSMEPAFIAQLKPLRRHRTWRRHGFPSLPMD